MIYLALVLSIFVVLGVHELGHLVVGLQQGFQLQLFVIGPLGIKREKNRIIYYFNKNLAYYGGICVTTPAEHHPDNAKKFGRIILAGPIASILLGILCLMVSIWIALPFKIIIVGASFMSFAIFLATTLPGKTGMFFTDRKRYQRLTTPGHDQEIELAIMRILGHSAKDESYRNVDKSDIELLIHDTLPFISYFGLFNLLVYEYEIEKTINEETESKYLEASKNIPSSMVKAMNIELEKIKAKSFHLKY